MVPSGVPHANGVAIDGRVLLFAPRVSVGTGILFGLAPALRPSKTEVRAGLKRVADSWRTSTVCVTRS